MSKYYYSCTSSENTFIRHHSRSPRLITLLLLWHLIKHHHSVSLELEGQCFNTKTWNGNAINSGNSHRIKVQAFVVEVRWTMKMSDLTSGRAQFLDLTSFICRRNIEEASADFTWKRAETSHCYSEMVHFHLHKWIQLQKLKYINTFATQHNIIGGSKSYFLSRRTTVRFNRRKADGAIDSNIHWALLVSPL